MPIILGLESSCDETVAGDVAEMEVSSGASDMARALEEARRILEHPSRINRELYVVSDRQAGRSARQGK